MESVLNIPDKKVTSFQLSLFFLWVFFHENKISHISPEKSTCTFIPTSISSIFNYTCISSVSSETPCDPNEILLWQPGCHTFRSCIEPVPIWHLVANPSFTVPLICPFTNTLNKHVLLLLLSPFFTSPYLWSLSSFGGPMQFPSGYFSLKRFTISGSTNLTPSSWLPSVILLKQKSRTAVTRTVA